MNRVDGTFQNQIGSSVIIFIAKFWHVLNIKMNKLQSGKLFKGNNNSLQGADKIDGK